MYWHSCVPFVTHITCWCLPCFIVYFLTVYFIGDFIEYPFGAADHLKVLCVGLFYWINFLKLIFPSNFFGFIVFLYLGNGNPFQYSCLEYPMDRGAWQTTVHGVARVGHDLVIKPYFSSVQFTSVAQSCPILCDPMNCTTLGLPVHHQLLEFIQTHVHRVSDAIQSSHPLLSPSPPAPNPFQHQSLFQWFSSLHEVAKVSEFHL